MVDDGATPFRSTSRPRRAARGCSGPRGPGRGPRAPRRRPGARRAAGARRHGGRAVPRSLRVRPGEGGRARAPRDRGIEPHPLRPLAGGRGSHRGAGRALPRARRGRRAGGRRGPRSARRPRVPRERGAADAMAGDTEGAAGLTQILAETGQNLLGMQIDVDASARLTRQIARRERRGLGVDRLRLALRRSVDQRFDPARALEGTARYLRIARRELGRARPRLRLLPHGDRQPAGRAPRLRRGRAAS